MGKFLQYFPSLTKLIFQSLGLKYFNNNELDFWRKKKAAYLVSIVDIYVYQYISLYICVYICVCVYIYMYPTLQNNILYIYTHPWTCAYCIYIYIYKMATFLACVCPRKGGLIVLDVCSCYLEGCNFIFHLFFPI